MGILDMIDQYIQNSGLGNTTSGILGGGQPQQGLLGGGLQPPQAPMTQTPQATDTPSWKVGLGQQNPYSFALSSMSDIIGGWGKTPLQQSETLKNRADAQLAQAQSQTKGQPFSGDNFDSQLVRQRAGEYIKAGMPADQALSAAANDVLQTKQQFVPNPDGSGNLVPVGRGALPPISSANVPQGTSPQVQVQDLPPQGQPGAMQGPQGNTLGLPTGTLLPPPSGSVPGQAIRSTGMPAVDVAAAKATAEAQAKAAVEKQTAQPAAESALLSSVNELDNVLSKVDQVAAQSTSNTTGAKGAILSNIPGTAAHDMSKNLVMLNANSFINALQQMRNQSKTGGAVGNVTEAEGEKLQSKYASLAQSQSKEQFDKNLGEFKTMMGNSRNLLINAYKTDYGYVPDSLKAASPTTAGSNSIKIDLNGNIVK